MENTEQKDVTPEELEKRLDEIFGGEDNETRASEERNQSLLSNMDSLMLTLDWEISDETMGSFLSEVASLKSSLSQDRLLASFLKILQSLGKYIQKRKGQTHPEAFTLLQSVYADFKNAVESEEIPAKQKKELLLKDIEKYNALKSKISETKSGRKNEPEGTSANDSGPERQQASETTGTDKVEASQEDESAAKSQEAEHAEAELNPQSEHLPALADKSLIEAIEELKEVIRDEFRKLREDLKAQQFEK